MGVALRIHDGRGILDICPTTRRPTRTDIAEQLREAHIAARNSMGMPSV